jgi:transketolase
MRPTSLNCVYELAQKDERVVFIGSDLGPGVLDEFKKNIPERFFMEGVAEQHIVGMAAGLALEGFIPYVNTIATFLTRRCYEQNVLDLGLHNTNVRLIANGGGTVYAPLGPTHLAIEDIAIMRTIPNMTIVSPADADEMRRFMMQTLDYEGPIYIRLGKGYDPIVSSEKFPFEIGKGILMQEGSDLLIVTTGISLALALEAADNLKKQNINASVLHMHTIKPLDKEALVMAVDKVPAVITLEEHTVLGGLGSACAEIILEEGFNEKKSFKRIGIPDVFPEGYGNQKDMMARNGISVSKIVRISEDLLKI